MITDNMKPAFQGIIPSTISTCSKTGVPNVTMISQVYCVSDTQVALSHQFFNKTIKNIAENPFITVIITNPKTFEMFRLHLKFAEAQKSGPVFEAMNTKIEAIASMTGMQNIFKLKSADLYDIIEVDVLDRALNV